MQSHIASAITIKGSRRDGKKGADPSCGRRHQPPRTLIVKIHKGLTDWEYSLFRERRRWTLTVALSQWQANKD